MKNQAFFSSKDKSKKLKCRLLQFLFGAFRVNIERPCRKQLQQNQRTRPVSCLRLIQFVCCLFVFWFSGPFRQYFSLYRAVSQREGERGEKG